MVGVAQSVRASGCGSEGRGFDPHHSPHVFFGAVYALVAQLDRATDFGSVGCRFDSCRAHHSISKIDALLAQLDRATPF